MLKYILQKLRDGRACFKINPKLNNFLIGVDFKG